MDTITGLFSGLDPNAKVLLGGLASLLLIGLIGTILKFKSH
jgi:hypothetical protein